MSKKTYGRVPKKRAGSGSVSPRYGSDDQDPYHYGTDPEHWCCGSGSAFTWLSWIRIRIGNADPDPGA